MFIDTHTHLYVSQFDDDREIVVQRAIDAGVERMLLPNIDSSSIPGMMDLEAQFPEHCFAMMGLHPCSVNAQVDEELAVVREWLDKRSFVAVGEIGIDLYWDQTYVEEQKRAFLTQTDWALEKDLPIVIHSRESTDLLIELLQPYKGSALKGIFHCFTGTVEQAEAIMELGFLMGIGGVLTFKKAKLDEVLREVPLEALVLETDSPYLAPTPYRGKRNESGYIPLIAAKLAAAKEMELEAVERQTTENAKNLFRITTKLV
ncbi:MAG: TatD family hydrolase [Phaeodactylibacter sp.]|nr:TatD family hydrolase [Phaeodactylibacter sp.]